MKVSPMMQLIDQIPDECAALRENAYQLPVAERNHIIAAFNAGAMQEFGGVPFYSGEEYYDKTYPDANYH